VFNNSKGQSLLELVVGLGLVVLIVSALAFSTISGLRNSQFSKNQAQATKYAQEYIERVRTIKNNDYAVCLQSGNGSCTTWSQIWATSFGQTYLSANGACESEGCTFYVDGPSAGCNPLCLKYSANPASLNGGFLEQVIIQDEVLNQKKVIVNISWNDTSGSHKSQLVTVLSKF
jgi:type II secretory pathway pseudopilin PulG